MKKNEEQDLGADAAEVALAGSIVRDAATARHTAGPWFVEAWSTLEVVSGVGMTICRTTGVAMPLTPEREANARLIAAAPEMYEALKYALRCFDRESYDLMKSLDPVQAIALAKHAIAKAEGR